MLFWVDKVIFFLNFILFFNFTFKYYICSYFFLFFINLVGGVGALVRYQTPDISPLRQRKGLRTQNP